MQRYSGRPQGGMNSFRRLMRRRPKPLWLVIVFHVLTLTAALLIYAVPHHIMPRQQKAVGIQSSRASIASSTAAPAGTPVPAAEPDNALIPAATEAPAATIPPADGVGEFRVKFADKFTSGEVLTTDTTYQSANINVSFSTMRFKEANVHIADIYVADISNFITVFGRDVFYNGTSKSEMPAVMAERRNGIATLSGDYYGVRDSGVVIRNGVLYRDEKQVRDICVLYWDGSVKCFSPQTFDAEKEMAAGAYQAWNFGPMLLTPEGLNMETFNSDVTNRHPRSIFGYYEPGHYCFIMVDGRSDESRGLEMEYCSILAYTLGLKQAYNLDGGETAALVKGTEIYGNPYKGGREVSDVLMIIDGAAGEAMQ